MTVLDVGVARAWDVGSRTQVGKIRPTSLLTGKQGLTICKAGFAVFTESVALNHDGSLVLLGLNDGTAGIFSTGPATSRPASSLPGQNP